MLQYEWVYGEHHQYASGPAPQDWTSNPLANKTPFWTSRSSFITSPDDFHSFICSIIYCPPIPSHAARIGGRILHAPSQWTGLRRQRPQTWENPQTGFVTKPDNTLARIKWIYNVPIQFSLKFGHREVVPPLVFTRIMTEDNTSPSSAKATGPVKN